MRIPYRNPGLILVSILICGLISPAARADRQSRVEAERALLQARKDEAGGNSAAARFNYANAFIFGLSSRDSYRESLAAVSILGEPLSSVGRKAISMQSSLVESGAHNASFDSRRNEMVKLQNLYNRMQELEPNNPNWYYLEAVVTCELEHHYVKARRFLVRCLRCPGSSPVKGKASKLLAHIKAAADQQQIWLDQDGKRSREWLRKPIDHSKVNSYASSNSGSSSSSSSSSIPDYERRARDAESRGDHGAAGRFRSGNASVKDSSTHW
ncbi:hypothetical protein GC174_16080 [bacterium]|nr:hypothetical protein [bacterium]